jgi:hypothetical protein
MKGPAHVVYWLFDEHCTDVQRDGYVGATGQLPRRLHQHRTVGRIPEGFRVDILFRGTKDACLAVEKALRPHPGIGWNIGIGGSPDGGSGLGTPKSDEHRAKLRAAALRRWSDPEARAKQSAAVKEGLKDVDRSGVNNTNFGKHMSEESKQKVRDAIQARGGINGANNPNWRGGRPAP